MTCPTCRSDNPPQAVICTACAVPLRVNSHPLPLGTKLHRGRYSIGRVLGEGGFCLTYSGADVQLRRPVTIKELFPEGSTRAGGSVLPPSALGAAGFSEALARFRAEASTLARFNHDSIARVLDVFYDNNTFYLVMEFLKGETLEARLVRQGTLAPDDTISIGESILTGLETVHAAGLLHRDIKPDNIILTEDGRVVLIDFGSARDYVGSATLTLTHDLTPGYAAPEQYEGTSGVYTDFYALGATLYHCLEGKRPPAALERLAGQALPKLPPEVPESLRRAIESALALEPDLRPPTSRDFKERLRQRLPPPVRSLPPLTRLKPQPVARLEGHRRAVTDLSYHPDGTRLASSSEDGSIYLWDTSLAQAVAQFRPNLSGSVSTVAFSPEGSYFVSGGFDGRVRFWDAEGGDPLTEPLLMHSDAIHRLRFSSGGKLLASAYGRSLYLWNLEYPSPHMPEYLGHRDSICSLALSPDGRYLASSSHDTQAYLWYTSDAAIPPQTLMGDAGSVHSVAFSPDSNILATGHSDSTIRLWHVPRLTLLQVINAPAAVWSLAYNRDGSLLASGDRRGQIQLWDTARATFITELVGHLFRVSNLSFSPDGRTLASGSDDRTVRLWRLYE